VPEDELRDYQREHCSRGLLDAALRKALVGLTSLEEALQLEMAGGG